LRPYDERGAEEDRMKLSKEEQTFLEGLMLNMAQNVDPQPKKVVEQGQVDQIAQDKEINILNLHVTSNIRFHVLMEMEISVKVTPILTPQVAASDATFGTKSINRFLASPQLLGDLPQIEPIQAPPPDISPVFESPCPILEELEPTQEDQSHHPKIPELSMVTSEENPDNSLAKLFSEIYSLKYLRNKTRHDQKKELRNSTTLHASIQQTAEKHDQFLHWFNYKMLPSLAP